MPQYREHPLQAARRLMMQQHFAGKNNEIPTVDLGVLTGVNKEDMIGSHPTNNEPVPTVDLGRLSSDGTSDRTPIMTYPDGTQKILIGGEQVNPENALVKSREDPYKLVPANDYLRIYNAIRKVKENLASDPEFIKEKNRIKEEDDRRDMLAESKRTDPIDWVKSMVGR